jgi:hypothetical protein
MTTAFEELLEMAGKLGIVVRHAHLGGAGGGLARFKQGRHLFVDLDAPSVDQLEQTARALAGVEELDTVYVRPDVRALLETYGRKEPG